MRIERTAPRVLSGEHTLMVQAARDIGHGLPRDRLDVLAALRCAIAGGDQRGGEFARGYRQALLDVMAAYAAAIEGRARPWYVRLAHRAWRRLDP